MNVSFENLAGCLMDGTDSGSDLVIGVSGEIFHEEVDQTSVALQDAQELERSVGGLELEDGLGDRLRFIFDKTEFLSDVGW
jgi:hypothetical protein